MPKQENDIFEFNLVNLSGKDKNNETVDYVPVTNLNTEDTVLIPVSMFENQDEEQVVKQVHRFYYQHILSKKYLNSRPHRLKKTANIIKNNIHILNTLTRQIALDLYKITEYQIKTILETKNLNVDNYDFPNFTKILDEQGRLKSIKLDIDENKMNQLIEQIKKDLVTRPENEYVWEKAAEEILISHLKSAIKENQQDSGKERLNYINYDETFDILDRYFDEEKIIHTSANLWQVLHKCIRYVVESSAENLGLPDLNSTELDLILGTELRIPNKSTPVTESRLTNPALPIPSFAAFKSAIIAQIRKDLWQSDSNGFATFKHQSKSNSKNYIEHYISSPGDIEVLPLEQAEQIIDKFGFNTVKLHLIFAAHTMNQERPWDSKFSLKASDVIKYLGWDKRTDLPVHQKLSEIAKTAFVLDCLLVKSVWIEGRNKNGGIDASTPTGRMWNVAVDPRGEQNLEGKIEKPREVYITVQPGLIFHSFLNKAGSQLKEALYQFGYLAQDILRIDPYHDELALRLAIHLAMDSRVHVSGKYRVETLLKHLLPHAKIDKARIDTRRGYDLKQRWDNALKLLKKLSWQIQFDESYPLWLQPGCKLKKPADARKMKIIEWLLQAKITIHPPQPIPELLASKTKPKQKAQKPKRISATGITCDQIRKGRNAKGWSQRKLAGWLGVTQTLVGYWEKGKRTPSEAMEIKLRQILEIID
ncbi:MAG: helix-turn-helix transcriptional regulator [Cyanobacteria bacterium J06598_4]